MQTKVFNILSERKTILNDAPLNAIIASESNKRISKLGERTSAFINILKY